MIVAKVAIPGRKNRLGTANLPSSAADHIRRASCTNGGNETIKSQVETNMKYKEKPLKLKCYRIGTINKAVSR